MENLDSYLASIQRVHQASDELRESNLGFCEITIRRLVPSASLVSPGRPHSIYLSIYLSLLGINPWGGLGLSRWQVQRVAPGG